MSDLGPLCPLVLSFQVFSWIFKWDNIHIGPLDEWFSPPVKYFTDRSNAVLLLWIFYGFFRLVFAMLCACLLICVLWSPAGKGLTSWLSFVVSNWEFVTFPLVSWVKCGSWLYRFLILALYVLCYSSNCFLRVLDRFIDFWLQCKNGDLKLSM